ncbi:NUDIX hydrolase [Schleiferilactobacillus shenzhenensis]|uniref:Nudix hydrolase domain-containing protein n=1 Tax=Schleiferilactobacillus shenzhenensis LY-73 TaxID=1231336 RepID=U4TPJ8_9LACO|nr:NUDIX hydrolase [Schleiferilactobacillus shenzhenensis]ERL66164.1 hypothetical protein L248_1256 [Schleiferilactobacillus shenzhenensis LY-73]
MTKPDYIHDIRRKVGHMPIILTFAGGILVDDRDEVLLQQRTDFDAWGLPGGAMEFGETAPQTCVREYQEETGLDVAVTGLLGISTSNIQHYPNGDTAQSVVVLFTVQAVGGELNPDNGETLALQYFAADRLPHIFNKQHENAIARYYAGAYPFYD